MSSESVIIYNVILLYEKFYYHIYYLKYWYFILLKKDSPTLPNALLALSTRCLNLPTLPLLLTDNLHKHKLFTLDINVSQTNTISQ